LNVTVGIDASHIVHIYDSFTKHETTRLLERKKYQKIDFVKRKNLFANFLVETVNETEIQGDVYTIYFSNIGVPETYRLIISLMSSSKIGRYRELDR
jgi:hypothetical protein